MVEAESKIKEGFNAFGAVQAVRLQAEAEPSSIRKLPLANRLDPCFHQGRGPGPAHPI